MLVARTGILRFIALFILCACVIGSSLEPFVLRASPEQVLAEYRLYRKSRLAGLEIPRKTALWMEHPQTLVNLDPYMDLEFPDLAMYRAPDVRNALIDFFVSTAGNEEIAVVTLYYANLYNVPPLLAFSLAWVESRFQPQAVNRNPGSVDRGVFQLNNLSFPHLKEDDFFNIEVNIKHGIQHLSWCLSVSSSASEALGVYNAGLSRIRRGEYPASTRIYIQRVMDYQSSLLRNLFAYLQDNLETGQSAG